MEAIPAWDGKLERAVVCVAQGESCYCHGNIHSSSISYINLIVQLNRKQYSDSIDVDLVPIYKHTLIIYICPINKCIKW
jgi:hypothetical protein